METQIVKAPINIPDMKAAVLTTSDLRAQVNLIQYVMKDIMKDGVHFGKVPGCGPKPTLLKAGAEKILSTFRIAVEPDVADLSTDDEIRYRVTAKGIHAPSGMNLGCGVGEASSNEEKYKWRESINNEEFEETDPTRRREKWKKGYNGAKDYKVKQIRTQPSDIANTVLKMAKKRALIDLCLTATAASDIFSQDIEEEDIQLLAAKESGAIVPSIDMDEVPQAPTVPDDSVMHYVFPLGKYKGRRLAEIADEVTETGKAKGIEYLQWFSSQVPNTPMAKEAQGNVVRFLDLWESNKR